MVYYILYIEYIIYILMQIHEKEFKSKQVSNTCQSQEIDKDNEFQILIGIITLCLQ
jgi:hypothetical protein